MALLIALGLGLIAVGGLLIRYRAPIADWQIAARVEEMNRASVLNDEYVERRRDSLEAAGSRRLSRLLVALFGLFVGAAGIAALVSALV